MDDFEKYEEYMLRLSSAFENSQSYRELALASITRGDYTTVKFQITQELRWYCAYASLRDALQTGEVLASAEYLDEFIAFAFAEDSPYLKSKDRICKIMEWDANKEHMDERIVSRFLDSCVR